jgi:glucose-6-phosphate isomerase
MFERYDDNEYAKEIVSLNDQHKWTVALVLEVIKMTQQHDINGEEHKLFLHTQFSLAQVYLCLEQLNNADACRRMATNRRVS